MASLRSKVRAKKNKHWTLVVIPDGQEKVSNYKLPCWLLRGVAALSVIAVLAGIHIYLSYRSMQSEIYVLGNLKAVNQMQKEEITRLQQQAQEMEQKMQAVQNLDRQVRELVGLKHNPPASQGPYAALSSRSARGGNLEEREKRIALLSLRDDKVESLSSHSSGLKQLEEIDSVLSEIEAQSKYQINNLEKLHQEVTDRLHFLEAVPNNWPLEGRLSSRFGFRRSPFGNFREFHDGIDIVGPRGAVVTAAGAGRVTFVGWKAGFGRTVVINHGYGYSTLYGHNSAILVRVGQTVKKDAPIARVGSTGRSTGPHVHLTIFRNGAAIDPLKVLQ